jgi:hypothetical protein
MRTSEFENIVTTGQDDGRRDRGRQRDKMLNSLIAWHGMRSSENMSRCMINRRMERHDCISRQAWHIMTMMIGT